MLIRDGCCDGLVTIGVAQVKVAPVIIYSAISGDFTVGALRPDSGP